jgi:hypothetical protein
VNLALKTSLGLCLALNSLLLPIAPMIPIAVVGAATQTEFSEKVFVRALIAGDSYAIETWMALHQQSPQLTISLSPELRLHPISIVLNYTNYSLQLESLLLLLKLGAHFGYQEPDLGFKTPLHMALDCENENQASELIRFILSNRGQGALAISDQMGHTPLEYARLRYPNLATSLEKFKTQELSPMNLVYEPTAWARGEKALKNFEKEQSFFDALADFDAERINRLMQAGVSPAIHSLDRHWQTPLHKAIGLPQSPEQKALMTVLLSSEVAREAKDWEGNRPLHQAAALGKVEIMQLLKKSGASLQARNNAGQTPLAVAAQNAQVEAVKWLLEMGANPKFADNQGLTPSQKIQNLLQNPDLALDVRGRLLRLIELL